VDVEPPVVGQGRTSEIVALDERRVLRRTRGAMDLEREAAVMRYARERGYPAPEVFEVRPEGLVLERIAGPTMVADLVRHPWRAGSHARTLAGLHRRLHRLPPPPGVAARYGAAGESDVLLHGDLHPLNVLLSAGGPVVIDWTNAGRGPAGADVADVWLLLAAARVPGDALTRLAVTAVRGHFLRRFLDAAGREEAARYLEVAATIRDRDPHTEPAERAAMRKVVSEVRRGEARRQHE
jgi:aminoglycoside phosphotransferase (APT) family kinase protein